jgi:hypothetical protein
MTNDEHNVMRFLCAHGPTLLVDRLSDAAISRGASLEEVVQSLKAQGYIDHKAVRYGGIEVHLTQKGLDYCGGPENIPRLKP